jgi:hypothetical protein
MRILFIIILLLINYVYSLCRCKFESLEFQDCCFKNSKKSSTTIKNLRITSDDAFMVYQLIVLPPEFTRVEDHIKSIIYQNYQELDSDYMINMMEQLNNLNINIHLRRRMINRLDHLRSTRYHYFQYRDYIENQLNTIQKLNRLYKEILGADDITDDQKRNLLVRIRPLILPLCSRK